MSAEVVSWPTTSAHLYEAIVENTLDFAIFALDLDGRVATWNAGARQLFGWEAEEIVGESAARLFTPEDVEVRVHESELAVARERGRAEDVRWHLHKSGTRFFANGVMMALHDQSGQVTGFVKMARDDTARKKAEDELREARSAFDSAFNAAGVATWRWIAAQNRVTTNARLKKWFGIMADEDVTLDHFLPIVHPEDRARVEGILTKRFVSGGPFEIEYRIQHASEPVRWVVSRGEVEVDAHGRVVNAAGVLLDISRRKEAEAAARESERQFTVLANSIPQLAWIAERDGAVFWYNQRWYDYTGTTLEEMKGWGWQSVQHPEEVERVKARYLEHLASGEPWEDTFPLRSRDGEFRWFLSRALPIRDGSGEIVRWFGTNTDIEDLRRARQGAEEANRVKDEFLATLSHELRTPLNAILGWASILRTSAVDEETTARALEIIERNARSQAQLIEDILDVSRIISSKLRLSLAPVDLREVVSGVIEAVAPSAGTKNLRLESDHEAREFWVNGDATRLQQVVWNLLSNAIKFTPENGGVCVELKEISGEAVLTVSDTGQGIAREFLPHVFDRFRQADSSTTRNFSGLGLGLAIVRHLVELHEGRIEAESGGIDQGAKFRVILPLLKGENGRQEENKLRDDELARVASLPDLSGIRCVVVDDEADARRLIRAILERCNAQVRAASSVEKALEEIERERPDLLISDIGMPGRDGYALIEQIRRDEKAQGLAELPALALTAFVRSDDRVRALQAGFFDHLAKPVSPQRLLQVVQQLLQNGRKEAADANDAS